MKVRITSSANKQLKKCPNYIQTKFEYWVDLVFSIGLAEARKYKGFHDEPLKGKRKDQRSIRLSKAYRAIYQELAEGEFEIIEVLEVNKHEY